MTLHTLRDDPNGVKGWSLHTANMSSGGPDEVALRKELKLPKSAKADQFTGTRRQNIKTNS